MIGQKKRSTEEYHKLPILSSSDLRLFSLDRRKFYKALITAEEEIEDYNKSLLIGDITHTLLLQPEEFDNKFFLSICPEPPTGLMLAFTEALYKHTVANLGEDGNVTKEFEELAGLARADSGFKWTLDRILKEFEGSNAELYYKQLREAKTYNKTVVCVEDLSLAEKIETTLRTHPFTSSIFSKETDGRYIVLNEYQVESFMVLGLPMKAMLDKVVIDTKSKIIHIFDIKIVWDNIRFYREYYLKRRAFIQAGIYYEAALQSLGKYVDDLEEYTVNYPIFITADSANFYAPIKYMLTEEDMRNAETGFTESGYYYDGIEEIIENIKWCQESQDFTTSKDILTNEGFALLR